MNNRFRVVPNEDDGTSIFRARIVRGIGVSTKIVAMFVDSMMADIVCADLNIAFPNENNPRLHRKIAIEKFIKNK